MNTHHLRARLLFGLPVLFLAVAAYVQFGAMLNHDVAWYLVSAERMLNGGSYRMDFFEINLPHVVAIHIPPYLLSRVSNIVLPDATRIWVFLLAAQGIALTLIVRRWHPRPLIEQPYLPFWLSWLVIGFLVSPGYNLGQREHLMVILATPFLFMLLQSEAQGFRVIRIYITALAAVGFYLKPHFAFLPFLLLGVSAYREGSWRRLLTPDLGVLLVVGGVLALWLIASYPDWFRVSVWTLDLYGSYGNLSWKSLLRSRVPIVGACLLGLLALSVNRNFRDQAWPLLTAGVYACLAFLLQMKGWKYQFLPVVLFAFIASGLAVAWASHAVRRKETHATLKFAIAGAIAFILAREAVTDSSSVRRAWTIQYDPVAQALHTTSDSDKVFVFATEMYPAFPALVHLDLKWGSRYSTLWPLPRLLYALLDVESDSSIRLVEDYWEPFVTSLAEDFARYKPRRVLVDLKEFTSVLPRDKDIVSVFLSNPDFAAQWQHYESLGDVRGYRVYQRIEKSDSPD